MKVYGSFLILLVIQTLVYGRRVHNPCAADKKIPCDNGECVDTFHWCDDSNHCSDMSDEKYCKMLPWDDPRDNNCNEKHFVCADGMCFPASVRCDGNKDCFDSSDEKNCDIPDRDQFITSETEPEYHLYASTPALATETYSTLATPTDVYGRHTRRSYSNRHPDYPPPTPPVNPTAYYGYGNDYNPQRGYNHGGSGTYPGGQFPDQQSSIPSYTPETISRQRPNVPPSRTRPDSGRPTYSHSQLIPPLVHRESHILHPPRTIVYPPRITSSGSTRRTVRRPNYSHFFFSKNYTEDIRYNHKRNIENAKKWLLGQRDNSYTWGRDTPRALIALSLISNSFKSDVDDNELMRKRFESYLGLKLLRNETHLDKISTTKLAMYINALLATCQDPHNFFGIDLVDILFQTQHHLEQNQRFVNPLIYLTLCLTNKNVPVDYLETFLRDLFRTEISKDLHILATTVMACVAQQNPYNTRIRAKLEDAVGNLLNQMNRSDGSFGSKYSTALAAQALMSVNISQSWNYQKTLDYLAQQQLPDGSFGDMQATYYTILALSGRSLLHLRNTLCDPVRDDKKGSSPEDILNREGPRKSISCILRVGYPETFSTGTQLSLHVDTTLFEIMTVAAFLDSRFKFNYEYSSTTRQLGIHTIANIPNDPERGMFWTLYVLPKSSPSFDFRNRYTGDPGTLIPQNGDELLFWYLSEFLSY